MHFVRIVIALLILHTLTACGIYPVLYNGSRFDSPEKALAAQKIGHNNALQAVSVPLNAPLGRLGRVIIPSKAVIAKQGVRSDTYNDMMGGRDYVASVIYQNYKVIAEAIRRRNIFEELVIEEVDNEQPIAPRVGEAVIYINFFPAHRPPPAVREKIRWFYLSQVTKATQLPLGVDNWSSAGPLRTFIAEIESLVDADSPERIAAKLVAAEKMIEVQKIAAEKREEEQRTAQEQQNLNQNLIRAEQERIAREGDGSEDDLLCKKRKLTPSTAPYLSCRAALLEKRKVEAAKANDTFSGDGRLSLDGSKSKCIDLGFKAGTEAFGKCVLQLSK